MKGGHIVARKKSGLFDQTAYVDQYHKEHYVRVGILLHKIKDADIIERLNKMPSKSSYVRELIRKDMNIGLII